MASIMNYTILRILKLNDYFDRFDMLQSFGISTQVEESDYLLCPAELIECVMKK